MRRKNQLLSLLPVLFALLLELSPHSALLRYQAQPDGEAAYIDTFRSYFDVRAVGAGSFGPFLTAVLTVLLLAVTVALLFKSARRGLRAAMYLAGIAAVCSLLPLFLGMYTLVGLVITLLLATEWFLLFDAARSPEGEGA